MNKITREKLVYNKTLIANAYINRGKYVKAYNLICKIEKEVEGESQEVRKTMLMIANLYKKCGFAGKCYTIYKELKQGKWGKCETQILEKITSKKEFEKVKKFAPPPQLSKEEKMLEKEDKKIDEKIVLAKFYFERKKSRINARELLNEILNSEKQNDFNTRKTMYQASKLYGQIGLTNTQKVIEMDLAEGKWGKCEEEILNKLDHKEKKDLWDKTKELFNSKIRVRNNNSIILSKC